jgi:hypothetical protein
MKIIRLYVSIVLLSSFALQGFVQEINNIEIKCADTTTTPDKVLFYNESPVEAKKFISHGLRPIHLVIHNKSTDPIVISTQSVGEQQPDVKEIIELFQIRELGSAALTLIIFSYFTGFVNTIERNNPFPLLPYYPVSIAFLLGSFGFTYAQWQHACNQNSAAIPLIRKHILTSRIVIPAGVKRETIVLIDTSVSVNRWFFDVFNLAGSIIAPFDITFAEEGTKS